MRIGGLCPDKCHLCGLQTRDAGSVQHERMDQCRKLTAQRQCERLAAEMAEAAERKFTAYQKDILCSLQIFKYLSRVISGTTATHQPPEVTSGAQIRFGVGSPRSSPPRE